MEYTGFIVAESAKAVLFEDWFWQEPKWLPKSQTTMREGDYEVWIKVSDWLSEQSGLREVFDE